MNKQRKCVFSGTFDPPTLGHKEMIVSARALFDELVIAIMVNPQKTPTFTLSERKEMLELICGDLQGVKIMEFSGTVAELLEKEGTNFYLRGIRNTVDFEYENANYFATKKLKNDVIPVYLPCPQELLHVSSSMVKNSLKFGTPINEYVTKEVEAYIRKIQSEKV